MCLYNYIIKKIKIQKNNNTIIIVLFLCVCVFIIIKTGMNLCYRFTPEQISTRAVVGKPGIFQQEIKPVQQDIESEPDVACLEGEERQDRGRGGPRDPGLRRWRRETHDTLPGWGRGRLCETWLCCHYRMLHRPFVKSL